MTRPHCAPLGAGPPSNPNPNPNPNPDPDPDPYPDPDPDRNPNPNPNPNPNQVLQAALEAPLEHSNAARLDAREEPIAMLSGSAPLSPGTRPMRLVPRSPRELDRRRVAGHAPGTGGTFGTPVIDGMLKASSSLEKRGRSVASPF